MLSEVVPSIQPAPSKAARPLQEHVRGLDRTTQLPRRTTHEQHDRRSRTLLRALVETEINARDASNTRLRGKQACFPMVKTLAEFELDASSIPAPTWAYLTSLEWIAAKENLTLVGPAGTGKSHTLIALGHAAVAAGHRVRYFTAAELVETLYRGLADNSVGRIIETVLRNDVVMIDEVGFAPLDDTGTQMLFRFVAAAYERRAWPSPHTGPSSSGADSCPSTPPPSASWTGCCTTTTSPPTASPTGCAKPASAQEAAPRRPNSPARWGLSMATSGDTNLAIDTGKPAVGGQ